ncbi:FAD-dependent monooxygenase [Bradyrhizobium cenepequi]|uniref:FAD-dependent monooxygenase n=1 Tax=Bradyrhizobium cenepequi TaxID=2821403 RepID=UPI001CE38844|nr:FAD-dependent monooxygenase [Bradyrhizobium cenepequi]MCA6105878.1 FAD-dependent monooxygenase [Bradyrhizobium cenepequi]
MSDHSTTHQGGRILVSGASIAGPTIAYWLDHFGFDVTVVERAEAVRSGGYPIDVRGPVVEVADRMGILPGLKDAHIHAKRITFLLPDGSVAGTIRPEEITGGVENRDIELPRGELTKLLYGLTRDGSVRYIFNESIASLDDDGAGVTVTFENGTTENYDVVIGADGLHSNTRRLIFGPEEPFIHYLGYCYNGFTTPNFLELSHESLTYTVPGRYAVLSAVKDSPTLHAFLIFASEEPPFSRHQDPASQRRLIAEKFDGVGWEVPKLVEAMQQADDLYYDVVSQIHLDRWSKGRVVLVGDAAFAPSFLSGQGSSLAMVGAYILAGELATHDDPTDAFAAYERLMRPFAVANQNLAGDGGAFLLPRTQVEIDARNRVLASLSSSDAEAMPGDTSREVHSSLHLPDYM